MKKHITRAILLAATVASAYFLGHKTGVEECTKKTEQRYVQTFGMPETDTDVSDLEQVIYGNDF